MSTLQKKGSPVIGTPFKYLLSILSFLLSEKKLLDRQPHEFGHNIEGSCEDHDSKKKTSANKFENGKDKFGKELALLNIFFNLKCVQYCA